MKKMNTSNHHKIRSKETNKHFDLVLLYHFNTNIHLMQHKHSSVTE